MPICNVVRMAEPSARITKYEAPYESDGYSEILRWLADFYKREKKSFVPQEFNASDKDRKGRDFWNHSILQNGRRIGTVKMIYLGQEGRRVDCKMVEPQSFSLYFKNANGNPNGADAAGFELYFHAYIGGDPHALYRRTA